MNADTQPETLSEAKVFEGYDVIIIVAGCRLEVQCDRQLRRVDTVYVASLCPIRNNIAPVSAPTKKHNRHTRIG